jgi:hypothetical protein
VDRAPHLEADRFGALDPDLLGSRLERCRRPVQHVARGVGRIEPLHEQVLDIRAEVRGTPRNSGVVAEHDRRDARKRHARDVVGALRRDGRAVEAVHEPDRRHGDAEVRIVREERATGRRELRGDHPVVRADTMVAHEPVGEVEARGANGGAAQTGDGPPPGGLLGGEASGG